MSSKSFHSFTIVAIEVVIGKTDENHRKDGEPIETHTNIYTDG